MMLHIVLCEVVNDSTQLLSEVVFIGLASLFLVHIMKVLRIISIFNANNDAQFVHLTYIETFRRPLFCC